MIQAVIWFLAGLTLISDIFIVLFLLMTFVRSDKSHQANCCQKFRQYLARNSLSLVFIVSFTATLGSLFFSAIAKFTPCVLCWYQRIFMYPQPFLTVLALRRKEAVIIPYLLLLNLIGLPITLYHYLIQRLPAASIGSFCQIGGTVSCTKNFTLYFGYITIPLMAATAFLLNIILLKLKPTKSRPGRWDIGLA